tara:strand:+ start:3776 stop:4102 length:327 start_codon:yes stop_codon:yes gene_type:complete
MSNIETLYSKEFKGNEANFTFEAKSKKLHLMIEEQSNISCLSLSLKGKKQHVHIRSFYTKDGPVFEFPTFEGETYQVTISSAGELGRNDKDEQFEKPLSATISAIWEA